jgi:hypothetical protein
MSKLERVVENCGLGEGPHWDVATQTLYLVDIVEKSILKYTPETGKVAKASVGKFFSVNIFIVTRLYFKHRTKPPSLYRSRVKKINLLYLWTTSWQ